MAYNGVGSGSESEMPRFKPKGMLERTALADLWKHTLSRIPCVYGRLTYLASLRDPNSGHYRHHGLSAAFGRDDSTLAMRQSHHQVFREWLKLPISGKAADLAEYLTGLDEEPASVSSNWLQSGHYKTLAPENATRPQKAQFRQEVEILLQMIKNAASGERRSQGSTRSA